MDKFARDLEKGLLKAFSKKTQEAGEMIHREYVRQALEIESPEAAALGADQYWPRLTAYSVGDGHTLYKLDSPSQNEGLAIVYIPALKAEKIGEKLSISPDGQVITGARAEQVFQEKQREFNVAG